MMNCYRNKIIITLRFSKKHIPFIINQKIVNKVKKNNGTLEFLVEKNAFDNTIDFFKPTIWINTIFYILFNHNDEEYTLKWINGKKFLLNIEEEPFIQKLN
jgi:hypothetical protein